jgi:hypothetical protein
VTPDCQPCEAEGLSRVLAVRDLLDKIVWGQSEPNHGLEVAIAGLERARRCFQAAAGER